MYSGHSWTILMGERATALITGGAGGIGAACASMLADKGYRVCLLDLDGSRVQDVAASIPDAGGWEVDICNAGAVDQLFHQLAGSAGACLVHAAALVPAPARLVDVEPADLRRVVDVNLFGTLACCRAFARAQGQQGGSIVLIGSISGVLPVPVPAYAATKAAIIHLASVLAADFGPQGIRVNALSPGPTRTPVIEESYRRGERDPRRMEAVSSLGRLVEPKDVAEAVAFLVSEAARAITGSHLVVDAGSIAGHGSALYR